ncbi:MAG: hypothetical protein J4F29_00455 [Candidatus Latescibacteria bacterium]|nr:hypothetical protein [Candidatus Latescibacterota bacterium]
MIIDATYLHIRFRGQVASEGVLIVSGIAQSGHTETSCHLTWRTLRQKPRMPLCLKTLKSVG